MNKKAVTPVIAVILLMLMMIAITGATWFWIQTVQGDVQEQASGEAETTASLNVPFSVISLVCEASTDMITATISNNGADSIYESTLFMFSVSDINGVGLGTNTSIIKSSQEAIPAGGAISIYGTIPNLNITLGQEYVVKVIAGASVQTVVCNAQ